MSRRTHKISQNAKLAMARVRAAAAGLDEQTLAEIAACDRLAPFIERAWPQIEPGTPYLSNWHIDAIAEHLEAVTDGQITRLLINMPPRYMKSIAVSVMWPVWEWTKRPELRFMFSTYAGSLSDDHSTQRRTILQSDWFREHWGHQVKIVTDSIETVANDRRGVFTATSFTGTATGKGGNRVVIDDPHNPKKAESDTERATTLRLFDTTFSNRLNDKKRDAVVVVMQRLHQKDVSARCMELGYVHLCLPCESEGRTTVVFPMSGRTLVREDGDLLWPEREGPKEVAAIRAAMGSYGYAGQYQQRPAPLGGGMFKSFPVVDAVPRDVVARVRYWDKAGSEGRGDWTAGVKMAMTSDGRFFVEHVVRGQWSAGARERIIKDTATADGPHTIVYVEQEPGSGGKESAESTVKNLAGFVVKIDKVTGDKVSRARPYAAQTEIGNVYLLRGAWNAAFIDEHQIFPNGDHDDMVDGGSGSFNKLNLMPRSQSGIAQAPSVPTIMPTPASAGVIPHAGRHLKGVL